jgi:hypothetical protein
MAAQAALANLAFLAVVEWMVVANRTTVYVVGEAKAGTLLLAEAKVLYTEYDWER